MKKEYVLDYNCGEAEVIFQIDSKKFKKIAELTLGFYDWTYDEDEGAIVEAARKYAAACLRFCQQESTNSLPYIQEHFEEEGFAKVNGEHGILLTSIYYPEIDDALFEVEIK